MNLINALVGDLFPPEGTTSMALEHHYMQQSKPAWNALTLAEMKDAYYKHAKYQIEDMGVSGWVDFAAAIETKLKEKNT
jgi:hypothetical protein